MIRTLARMVALWWRTTFRRKDEGARIPRQELWRRNDMDKATVDEEQTRLRVESLRFAQCEHGEARALCKICWPLPKP